MYDGIRKIEDVIDIIEANILEDANCDELAAKMNLSVYEFRRIFAFVVGCPISEYVRRRRLSLAACEILNTEQVDMRAISEKYGYSTQSAFIKAFGEQNGAPPTAYLKGKTNVELFTRSRFEMKVFGRESIPINIIKSAPFYISGFAGTSDVSDNGNCENVWKTFYESKTDKKLASSKIYAAYKNKNGHVLCNIGQKSQTEIKGLENLYVAKTKYACFKFKGAKDNFTNEKYSQILYEWLPSANLLVNKELPIIEVYPKDMKADDFEWEIRIPIL